MQSLVSEYFFNWLQQGSRTLGKSSRQSDLISGLENMNVTLGAYSRNELESNKDKRDLRSLLNTNSRQSNELP